MISGCCPLVEISIFTTTALLQVPILKFIFLCTGTHGFDFFSLIILIIGQRKWALIRPKPLLFFLK